MVKMNFFIQCNEGFVGHTTQKIVIHFSSKVVALPWERVRIRIMGSC